MVMKNEEEKPVFNNLLRHYYNSFVGFYPANT